MKNTLLKKGLVIGTILLFVGTGVVGAKSLYVNKDINANSPISAYDIQGPPNYLVYQMTSIPTRYGGAGLAIDTESEILFVTFEFSGTLDIVDAKTLNKLGTVTAPSATNLAGIVVDQDKQKVYTVDRNTDHLYVYSWDPVNKKLTNDITSSPYYISLPGVYYTGGHDYGLHGIALDELNDLLFACDVTKTIKIFNTADWSLAGSFTVSQRAMGIAVDEKNRFVYTGNAYAPYGSLHLLSKYDLNTNTENTINIGSYDNVVGLAVDQDTSLVYITTGDQGSGGSDQIRVYDSNLNFLYATGDIGNPTGLAIPSEKTGIHPPDADPGGPYYGNINEPIQLFGDGTPAKDRTIEAWEWTFDDTNVKSTEQNPKHTWSTAGSHIATLIVYDDKGLGSKPKQCDVHVVEPFTFVQISDVHMGYGYSVERFAEIIYSINHMKNKKPDFILITGDIAEKGITENYYTKFLDILKPLDDSIMVYTVPGNHDWYTDDIIPLKSSLSNYNKYMNDINFQNERQKFGRMSLDFDNNVNDYYFDCKGVYFIGLDSGYVDPWGISGDAETEDQWNGLSRLDPDIQKIIFMHHPVFDKEGRPLGDHRIQNNRPQFINYCKDYNVDLVLTGHTHDNLVFTGYVQDNVIYYQQVTEDDTKRPLFIQTTTATKEDNYGLRRVNVDASGAYPKKTERPQDIEKIIIWADGLTIPILGIYDSQERYTGITSAGSTETGITDSYYIGSQDDDGIILFNTTEEYNLIISIRNGSYIPQVNDKFNLTIVSPGSRITTSYYNVSIFQNTTINMTINKTTTNHIMYIDYDGDNEIDEEKSPDSIETDYAPNATIISPVNSSIYLLGEEIAFNGTGIDLEDGILTNSSLIWTSSIDGYIGNGNAFNTTNLSTGIHFIELYVNDSSGQITIENVTITIIAPDLMIDVANISFSYLCPVEGENVIINATIYNVGTANASNITIQFYNGNPLNGTQIGENQSIGSLNISESKTVSVIWDTTGYAGDNCIWVVVDSSENIKESNEENNWAYKSLFVGAPNLLHIVQAKTDRIAYLEGEGVLISCLVQNASGNITATVTAYIEEPNGNMNQMTMFEGTTGNYSRTFSNTYISGLYNITIVANRIGFTGDNEFFNFMILDTSIPSRITNLSNTTGSTWINWSWDKPQDVDFDHVLVYLNGVWKISASKNYYFAEELTPGAQYEIGILTVDKTGNINKRWVNQTTFTEGIIDDTSPSTTKTIYSPKYGANDIWITSNTTFNLSAVDDLSGVGAIYYQIWHSGIWTPWIGYAGNFTLSYEGKHYVEYYSIDNAGNVEETHNQTHYVDDTPPSITIELPSLWEALQDGVTLQSLVNDSCGVKWVRYSIRNPGGAQGIVINQTFESLSATPIGSDKWVLLFDTTTLPDGYYVFYVNASDNLGNEDYKTRNFSIRNWAVLELLPNTANNKAGRTIPVKFSLRIAKAVDPIQPFVRNEELTIKIYEKGYPETILQTSIYGINSTDYRINSTEEQYITNFKTLKTPKTYIVEIWRNDMLIGSFEFETVK